MTDTSPTSPASTTSTWTRWLYPALAITGIATGTFIVVAGLYLLIAQPSWGGPVKNSDMQSCCESMKADMKKMMDDMKNMPSMSPMPSMPSMSPMPSMPMPAPGR